MAGWNVIVGELPESACVFAVIMLFESLVVVTKYVCTAVMVIVVVTPEL